MTVSDDQLQLLLSQNYCGAPAEAEFFFSDEFRMYCYKVIPCSKRYGHDWTDCPFCHPGEKAQRRCPNKYLYTGIACPDMKKTGDCPRGDNCCFAHNVFEYWLHPSRYRTQLCSYGQNCKRTVCFFAHSINELRIPTATPAVEEQIQNFGFSLDTQLDFDGGFGPATFLPVPRQPEEQPSAPHVTYVTPVPRSVSAYHPRMQTLVTPSQQMSMQYHGAIPVTSAMGPRPAPMPTQQLMQGRICEMQRVSSPPVATVMEIPAGHGIPMNGQGPTYIQYVSRPQSLNPATNNLPSNVIIQNSRKVNVPAYGEMVPVSGAMQNMNMQSVNNSADGLGALLHRLAIAQHRTSDGSSSQASVGSDVQLDGLNHGYCGAYQTYVGPAAPSIDCVPVREPQLFYDLGSNRVYDLAY